MEIFLGMILLLQVLVSIQIMLMHRQVLQRLEKVESRVNDFFEDTEENGNDSRCCKEDKEVEQRDFLQQNMKENEGRKYEEKLQEDLINEVLSEVFF